MFMAIIDDEELTEQRKAKHKKQIINVYDKLRKVSKHISIGKKKSFIKLDYHLSNVVPGATDDVIILSGKRENKKTKSLSNKEILDKLIHESPIKFNSIRGNRNSLEGVGELSSVLKCPKCKKEDKFNISNDSLICVECGQNFPVDDDVINFTDYE